MLVPETSLDLNETTLTNYLRNIPGGFGMFLGILSDTEAVALDFVD